MPVRVHLDELLRARDMTLSELSDRVGITLANLSILKTGKARAIRFSTLEAVCEVLRCQPGDLLTMSPSGAGAAIETGGAIAHARPQAPAHRRAP